MGRTRGHTVGGHLIATRRQGSAAGFGTRPAAIGRRDPDRVAGAVHQPRQGHRRRGTRGRADHRRTGVGRHRVAGDRASAVVGGRGEGDKRPPIHGQGRDGSRCAGHCLKGEGRRLRRWCLCGAQPAGTHSPTEERRAQQHSHCPKPHVREYTAGVSARIRAECPHGRVNTPRESSADTHT